jgi:hypothetical protein
MFGSWEPWRIMVKKADISIMEAIPSHISDV